MKSISCAITILLFCQILNAERSWEQWDKDHVSNTIDAYWISSKEEMEHRDALAALTKRWLLTNDRLLEVGSGSGLVYARLVPDILPNEAYTGIDISEKMLEIAMRRFPQGIFIKDDLYALSFPDQTFNVVTAFEVFGHIDELLTPIREMFRVASRTIIFTVWTGPETKMEQELIDQVLFRHKIYSHTDLLHILEEALNGKAYTLFVQPLAGGKSAYIIQK